MEEAKVVIISGASRGIGRALALNCARLGWNVVVNYRANDRQAEETIGEINALGGRSISIKADVSRSDDVEALIGGSISHFGRIDAVINNAGVGAIVRLEDLTGSSFETTLRINLVSAFLVSQAAIPHMKQRGGRLIFMSSGAARSGGRISAAYAASKAGLEGLMHYYAANLLGHRITANAIAPSLIESDMVNEMTLPPLDQLPLGRLGQPDEIWPAVRMILETEYLTGQTVHINAGRYMS